MLIPFSKAVLRISLTGSPLILSPMVSHPPIEKIGTLRPEGPSRLTLLDNQISLSQGPIETHLKIMFLGWYSALDMVLGSNWGSVRAIACSNGIYLPSSDPSHPYGVGSNIGLTGTHRAIAPTALRKSGRVCFAANPFANLSDTRRDSAAQPKACHPPLSK